MSSSNPIGQASSSNSEDDRYDEFLAAVRSHFAAAVEVSSQLFTTDAADLWGAYLDAAPKGERQTRTCAACRTFIKRFGGLVTIDASGTVASAFWPKHAPPAYVEAARALAAKVEKANVTGVFRSSLPTWGTPVTGTWTHLAVNPPKVLQWSNAVTDARQAVSAKNEEHAMLVRSLADFPAPVGHKALALLRSGSLYRSEKCEAVATWLVDLHVRRASAKNVRLRDNLTWLAVGGAPPGHCHVRSGMIGTLLEDVEQDLPFATIKARFDAKMHPLQYQRPQTAPTAANVAQAEKIVAALKTAGSLERRFAKLADVQSLWRPVTPSRTQKTKGVFDHLLRRDASTASASGAPPTVMTWVKFAATVLPTAETIEYLVPVGRQPYAAMVTAQNPEAPPILQWDREDRRNPVSMYLYVEGSLPETWNLKAGQPRRVTAISLSPSMWDPGRALSHHGASVFFLLDGARDTSHTKGGGLFVESLKSEYHPVRRTLEAHFASARIDGRDEAEACGICLSKGASVWNATLRVTADGIRADYILDRWD